MLRRCYSIRLLTCHLFGRRLRWTPPLKAPGVPEEPPPELLDDRESEEDEIPVINVENAAEENDFSVSPHCVNCSVVGPVGLVWRAVSDGAREVLLEYPDPADGHVRHLESLPEAHRARHLEPGRRGAAGRHPATWGHLDFRCNCSYRVVFFMSAVHARSSTTPSRRTMASWSAKAADANHTRHWGGGGLG
ncbi:hypothetical protein HPB52_015402 [Rhipicephalus sanguineus]|uniref:Uncharacterized protein n=1 Tax=Rhipicephalus sanguineus TaxID=34632 RepID=A0A9D4T0K1_RHISA|nr:hypothetical protein HPB52_015402 [Rhipicephalus sanguineus]